jgi:Domain of unknown function (DUF4815)
MKSYNIAPYYDDFSQENGFHQVLFKPGYAVQARELTQLQTILRDQIEKFGNHIFAHGSVVIPGNSIGELGVPYVKLATDITNISDFENKVIVGGTTGIKATVRKAIKSTSTDPATLYLSYLSGNSSGNVQFSASETLIVVSNPAITTTVANTTPTGLGSLAIINAGVYYINGSFVYVDPQSIVISKYDTVPSCRVLLKINEQLVDYADDDTLLDPAQGSYNYAAPGADRLKIKLELVTLSLSDAVTSNYVEIMRYDAGELQEHVRVTKYSELEKSLARRTFDESGNYVVTGLETTIREHFKDTTYGAAINGGLSTTGSRANYVASVSAGKVYISGFETEKIATTNLILPKARTSDHIKVKSLNLRPTYGQYIIVTTFTGTFSAYDRQTISLWNTSDSTSGSQVGTAKIMGVDFLDGVTGSGGIYKLWISNLAITSPYTLEDVGGIRHTSGGAAVCGQYYVPLTNGSVFTPGEVVTYSSGTNSRTATVKFWNPDTSILYAFKHDHLKAAPKVTDFISSTSASGTIQTKDMIVSIGQSSMVFELPIESTNTLKNSLNAYNIEYRVQKELSITTNASGDATASISDGVIESIEPGNFVAISSAGAVSHLFFSIPAVNSTTISVKGAPANMPIKLYPTVKKTLAPKTKTRRNATDTTKKAAQLITLDVVDVYKINSITYISSGVNLVDVTNYFELITGQTDFSYDLSQLKMKPGYTLSAVDLTIQYSYYEHSAGGDYFSIDSYAASGIDHLDQTYAFISPSNGYKYNLKNCIDFRPSVGADGSFTGLNSRRNDLILPEYILSTDIQYFVPRIDVVYIAKDGTIAARQGIPKENPVTPALGVGEFGLDKIYVPAYTEKITDIKKKRIAVVRSTMQDILRIKERISRLEDAYTLTAAENNLLSYDVIDAATGQSRYKTGYLVEDFSVPFTIADSFNKDFRASFGKNALMAAFDTTVCDLELQTQTSLNYSKTNKCITLPYTERTLAEQPYSSRVTNLNPFLVISWVGSLSVFPQADHWVESIDLPTVFNEVTETVIINTRGQSVQSSPAAQTWNLWDRSGAGADAFGFTATSDNAVSNTDSTADTGAVSFGISVSSVEGVSLGPADAATSSPDDGGFGATEGSGNSGGDNGADGSGDGE